MPQAAPKGCIIRTESAFDLLERVKKVSTEWVAPGHKTGTNTHNVSATVSLKEDEWELAGEWMWENKAHYNGLSVLPYDGGSYTQAPFEDITEEKSLLDLAIVQSEPIQLAWHYRSKYQDLINFSILKAIFLHTLSVFSTPEMQNQEKRNIKFVRESN